MSHNVPQISGPPVNYQPQSLGLRSKTGIYYESDSLFVLSRPYASSDTSKKMDLMGSIIEIYDKNDLLLHRTIKTESNTHRAKQRYWLHPFKEDTFTIRTWGFGYVFTDDTVSSFERKKLQWGTTIYREKKYPLHRSAEEIARMDSIKKAQAGEQ